MDDPWPEHKHLGGHETETNMMSKAEISLLKYFRGIMKVNIKYLLKKMSIYVFNIFARLVACDYFA